MRHWIYPVIGLSLLTSAGVSWASKPDITIEVVSIVDALSHSPVYHPATPDTSTTVCTPDHDKCTTTTVHGYPAFVDNMAYYSQFLYVILPDGRHAALKYLGLGLVYPPAPGHYNAVMKGEKNLWMHVVYENGKKDTLRYHIDHEW